MPFLEYLKGFGHAPASKAAYSGDIKALLVQIIDGNGNASGVTPGQGTDRSGTTTANTSTTLMGANPTRGKFFVKNDSASDIWINMGATAVAAAGGGNIKIASGGGYFEFSGYTGVVNVISTAAVAYTAREF